MCIQEALGIASTGMGLYGQSQAADMQNQMYYQNATNANYAAGEKYAQTQLRLIQEQAKATEDRMILSRERMNAQGTALASSQNGGISEGQVINDIARQAARQKAVVNTNLQYKEQQYMTDVVGIHSENESRINSVSKGQEPSFLTAAISGLGTVLGTGETMPAYIFGNSADKPLSPIDERNMIG